MKQTYDIRFENKRIRELYYGISMLVGTCFLLPRASYSEWKVLDVFKKCSYLILVS